MRKNFGLVGAYELAALIIHSLKVIAETYAFPGRKISECVITYPAGWNNIQKDALIRAANIAGIENPILLKEPTAALYEIDRHRPLSNENSKVVVVLDYGGGTCDVTVCKTESGSFLVAREPEILAEYTEFIGGRNVDLAIARYFVKNFRKQYPTISLESLAREQYRLISEAKLHKEKFTNYVRKYRLTRISNTMGSIPDYNFSIPQLCRNNTLYLSWNEENFGEIIFPEVKKIIEPITKALKKARLKRKDVDLIALVGGSSLLPTVEKQVQKMFSPHPIEIYRPPHPRHAIVFGSAIFHYYERKPIQRSNLEGRKRYATLRIGLDKNATSVLVAANESLPVEKRVWEGKTPKPNMRFVDILT